MKITTTALVLSAVPLLGHAQDLTGYYELERSTYVSAYAGAGWLEDSSAASGGAFLPGEGEFALDSESDPGFVVGATAGVGFENRQFRTRFEADVAFRHNELDEVSISEDGGLGLLLGIGDLDGLSSSDVSGDARAISGLVNAWIDLLPASRITPYVGGGIGAAHVSFDDVRVDGVDFYDDSDLVFAWQAGAGVSFDVRPDTAVTLDYRFFSADKSEIEFADSDVELDTEYTVHNVMLGLRYQF